VIGAVSVGALGMALVAVPGAQADEAGEAALGAGLEIGAARPVAPGVRHQEFELVDDAGDRVEGDLLTVNLSNPNVKLNVLYPGVISSRQTISTLADAVGAVAGVNGDFFDIGGTPEIEGTNAPVGPAVADGRPLTAAVPMGQRWGPPLAAETTNLETVFGIAGGRATMTELSLDGAVSTPAGTTDLDGFNQYAIRQGGVGAFTSVWGEANRKRATCGSDTRRNDPCADETIEVVVTGGVVTEVHDEPRAGAIPDGTVVLVGREAGTARLDHLQPGDSVDVEYQLVARDGAEFDFAIGGTPILRGGVPLAGLQEGVRAPRTAAGASADGSTVYLVTVDGSQSHSAGISIHDLAEVMTGLGADVGLNLDGGGSSTMVARERGANSVSVRNSPSGGEERPVPNGIGVFSARGG
jgi:hypothetical protein